MPGVWPGVATASTVVAPSMIFTASKPRRRRRASARRPGAVTGALSNVSSQSAAPVAALAR